MTTFSWKIDTRSGSRLLGLASRRVLFYWGLLAPGLVFLLLFTYLPLFRALFDSFHDYRIAGGGAPFSGLNNYLRLFQDPNFTAALKNNLIYTVFTLVPGLVLALGLALALKRSTRVNRWLRAAFFFPTVVPLVAAASLWSFIFLPGIGLFDHYLAKIAGPVSHNFLGYESTALGALVVISIWKFAGYYMIFFLAGLKGIPDDAYEAALIEGAGPVQCFFNITLPLLRPTITFVGTVALVYAVTQIDHVGVMTNGGPVNSTTVILHYIQTVAMESQDFGKASAATVLTVLGLFVLSWINMKVIDRGTDYER